MQEWRGSTPSAELSARLADGLATRHALDHTMAAWAVSAWAHALDVAVGAWPVDPVLPESQPRTLTGQETVVAGQPATPGPPSASGPFGQPGPPGPPTPPPETWPPGPTPFSAPPPGRKGRGALIALIVGLGVLLLAGGGAGAFVGWNYIQDQRSTTSTTEEETTTTEGSTTTPTTAAGASLRQQAQAKGYNSCQGDPAAFAGQSEGVVCAGSVAPNTYGLYRFSTAAQLKNAYQKVLDMISPTPTQTMCKFGPASGAWNDPNKVTQGTLLCVKAAATFDTRAYTQAVWTDARDLTLRFLYVPDSTTYEALFVKWQQIVD